VRLLVDENVPRTVVELRQRGHDVLSAKESLRSQPDQLILARAQAEHRLIVTHDKDFGELAFQARLPASSGIILLRLTGGDSKLDIRRTLEALDSRSDWQAHFSVVTDGAIRMRPLIR
jgi:predicted nuclease of predicted toxin-antitoxin system